MLLGTLGEIQCLTTDWLFQMMGNILLGHNDLSVKELHLIGKLPISKIFHMLQDCCPG